MRARRPEGSQSPVLHAVTRRLHLASMRDRLDDHAHYLDGEAALDAALVEAVTREEATLCQRVAAGEVDPRALGPATAEAIELAGAALVETAGVRWRAGGWTVVDDAS